MYIQSRKNVNIYNFQGKKTVSADSQKPEKSSGGNNNHKDNNISPARVLITAAGFLAGFNAVIPPLYDSLDTANRVTSEQTEFESEKDADDYAKSKVVSALNNDYPIEYLVYIDNHNNILGEFKGNFDNVYGSMKFYDLVKTNLPGYSYKAVHGHPSHDDYSTPVSFDDFEQLNNEDALKELVVYNKNGEYSILRKTSKFKPIDEEEVYNLRRQIWNRLESESKLKMPERWEKLNSQQEIETAADDYEPDSYLKIVQSYQTTLEGIQSINDFWVETAPKLNLEYKTNYSYLN